MKKEKLIIAIGVLSCLLSVILYLVMAQYMTSLYAFIALVWCGLYYVQKFNNNNDGIYSEPGESLLKIGFTEGVKFAQKWTSVEEEMPEDGLVVLIKTEYDSYSIGYTIDGIWVSSTKYLLGTIHYWRKINL